MIPPLLRCILFTIFFNRLFVKLFSTKVAGADPGFFLGGGAPVSCSTSTPINHIVFFRRIPVVLENRRSSQVGGVRTPCTLPLDPPLGSVSAFHGFRPLNRRLVGGGVSRNKLHFFYFFTIYMFGCLRGTLVLSKVSRTGFFVSSETVIRNCCYSWCDVLQDFINLINVDVEM